MAGFTELNWSDAQKEGYLEGLRKNKIPKTIPKIIRDASHLPELLLYNGEVADKDVLDGLFRLFSVHKGRSKNSPQREVMLTLFEEESAGVFALALMELWKDASYHGRYEWIAMMSAALGDDRTALLFKSLIKSWQYREGSLRKKAIASLPLLADMNSPTSLMALVGMTHAQEVPRVYDTAVKWLSTVAHRKGMGWHELSDRVIPDCGLDQRGTRIFDVGEGQALMLILDKNFEPRLRDMNTGKVYRDLTTYKGGDAEQLQVAMRNWELMKSKLEEVIQIQTRRMEEAMITGRTWSVKDFQEVILHHPLMVNFSKRLVWGVFDADHTLVHSFRVSDEGELLDLEDDPMELDVESMLIGVAHPVTMGNALTQKWADSLGDYEIFTPFDQVGRSIYTVPEQQLNKKFEVPTAQQFTSRVLRKVMKREGWRRDADGGYIRTFFFKSFESYHTTAYITLSPGLNAGGECIDEDQSLTSLRFETYNEKRDAKLALAKVHPVCYSESRRFVELLEREEGVK